MSAEQISSPLSFAAFLDKMKEPAAADLVRGIKMFIKRFEDRKSGDPVDPEADSTMVQNFYIQAEQSFRTHPSWQGCGSEVLELAVEGLEKYIMSKIWRQTFRISREDKDRDERYHRLATALGFVDLATLAGTAAEPDPSLVEMAETELLKMDKYKAPRDKLLCLVNVKTLVEEIVTSAARAGAGFGGADAFFPVFLLVVIRAKGAHLASNIEYIRRFRSRPRLNGQFDFMLANLESAAMYLDTVDYQHLHISQDEFLARLADAGIPEADMALKLMNNSTEQQQEHIQTPIEPVSSADVGIVKHSEQQQQRNDVDVLQDESPSTPERASSTSQIAQSDGASLLTTTLAVDEMIGSGLTPLAGGSSTPEVLIKRPQGRIRDDEQPQLKAQPGSSSVDWKTALDASEQGLVSSLIEAGSSLVLQEERNGALQTRHPYIYSAAEDLTVADIQSVLAAYRRIVFQYEALSQALNQQEQQESQFNNASQPVQGDVDLLETAAAGQESVLPPGLVDDTAAVVNDIAMTPVAAEGEGTSSQPDLIGLDSSQQHQLQLVEDEEQQQSEATLQQESKASPPLDLL